MAKIGIITYHNNENRGAVLQSYCLWKALKQVLPKHQVEIIDYRTFSKEFARLYSRRPKILYENILDYNISIKFLSNLKALSHKKIITNSHNRAINFLRKENYDMIVVGSDVVWRFEGRNNIMPFRRPFPNAYFLDPNLDVLKVAYAASIIPMQLSSLTKQEAEIFKKHVSSFDKISVRDKYTEESLIELGLREIARVPDPTLLVDIPTINIKKFLESKKIVVGKPILGMHRVPPVLSAKIADYYHSRGFQVVSLRRDKNADTKLFARNTPLQYFSLFKHFNMVITASFHSTIFSIKNGIPFITIDIPPKDVRNKTYYLLKDFSLLDRYLDITKTSTEYILRYLKSAEKPLDRVRINSRLDYMKSIGIQYIQKLGDML